MKKGGIFQWITSNPILSMVIGFFLVLPLVIVGLGTSTAITSIGESLVGSQQNGNSCTGTYQQTIDSNFNNSDINKSQVEQGCPKETGADYNVSLWQNMIDRAQKDADSKMPYSDTELHALLILAENAGSYGSQGADIKAAIAVIDKEFADLEKKHHDASIYEAIVAYGTDKISSTIYNGTIGAAIVAAAKTKIGQDYVNLRGPANWNSAKQEYCGQDVLSDVTGAVGYQCGFDCSSLVGWAYDQAMHISTKNGILNSPWSAGAHDEHNWLEDTGRGTKIQAKDLAPGDLIFISYANDMRNADHVAIYAGKTPASPGTSGIDQWIEEPNNDEKARELTTNTPWWTNYGSSTVYEYWRPYIATVTTVSSDVASEQAYAKSQVVGKNGWTLTDYSDLVLLWDHESSWRLTAQNNAFSPSSPSTPEYQAYGIPQAGPGIKMATFGSDWKTNPRVQIDWGLSYIKNTYGSPSNAWAHEGIYNWY